MDQSSPRKAAEWILHGMIALAISIFPLAHSGTSTLAQGRTPYLIVLGIAQDGGYPQAGCVKPCCTLVAADPSLKRHVASIAIIDPVTSERWIIDATPDFNEQLALLYQIAPVEQKPGITGILLTHGHIGHYTGLIHLGREVMGTKHIPVFVMPRMRKFLEMNGPWDQLLRLENITLVDLYDKTPIRLNERISVTPFLVPHRDEYTETVGFTITGPNRSVVFIPDIDKWEKWGTPIEDILAEVDAAYLDGTFFETDELPGRNMAEIPHPFIVESMARFSTLDPALKKKVRFIHFNHTNPALQPGSAELARIKQNGFSVAEELETFEL